MATGFRLVYRCVLLFIVFTGPVDWHWNFSSPSRCQRSVFTSANVVPATTEAFSRNRAKPLDNSLDKSSDTAAAIKISEGILEKIEEQTLNLDSNDKAWIQTLLDFYGSHYLDSGRVKREANLSSAANNTTEESTRKPADGISKTFARWIIAVVLVLIGICSLCILYFYCLCNCRRSGSSRNYNNDNPRATVSVMPSKAPSRPTALLNNANPYGDHPRPPPGILEAHVFMKMLEKHPDRAAHLMYDL